MILLKILLVCAMFYLSVNVVVATYLFFKEKNEADMIVNTIQKPDKEGL